MDPSFVFLFTVRLAACEAAPRLVWEVRLEAGRRLLDAMRQARPRMLRPRTTPALEEVWPHVLSVRSEDLACVRLLDAVFMPFHCLLTIRRKSAGGCFWAAGT